MAHTVHKTISKDHWRHKQNKDVGSFTVFALFILFFVALAFIGRKIPGAKGRRGEAAVSRMLGKLDPLRYKVLNDVMLPSRGYSATTQIDHIVVSNYGIFCIETKALTGWIFGNAYQRYWTQVIFRHKERVYNPLWQNYTHVKAIEGLVGARNLKKPIVALVVFTRAQKIKVSGTNLVGRLFDVVGKIESHTELVYSDSERDEIHQKLSTSNILDEDARKLHVEVVRDLKSY